MLFCCIRQKIETSCENDEDTQTYSSYFSLEKKNQDLNDSKIGQSYSMNSVLFEYFSTSCGILNKIDVSYVLGR